MTVAGNGLIGRAEELRTLAGALDRAAAGDAGVVLVGGDAGVGKTRLVRELAELARERGCAVLVGQCAELGESMPYLPLADALWTASRDPRVPAEQAEALRAALAGRPVLGRLLPDGPGGAEGGGSDLVQQQLFGAALGLLGELADARPVLLVLEDLHWADSSSRHLLTFLSRVLHRERVCLVGTYRSDDLHRRHPLRPVIAELARVPSVSVVELRPFGQAETADYLAALEGDGLPPDVVARVHARSEGNPFYAAELLVAAKSGEDLPAGLADLLLARVERLSETARRVVRVAAVAGRRIDDRLVRDLSGLDEADCERALREIVEHKVLVPDGPAGYAFRHALLREAVYGELLPGERTRLHAAFAALLADDPRRPAAELAHHSFAAHDLPVAFAASVEAAHQAERVGAPGDASEHYDRALELWDAVPDAEQAAGTDRVHLSLRAAAASAAAGDTRHAASRVRQLLELVDPSDALLGSEVRERLAYYLGDLEQGAWNESMAFAIDAVKLLPEDPPTPQLARALATFLRTALFADQFDGMRELTRQALDAARASGAADAEASALVSLGLYEEIVDADFDAEQTFAAAWRLGRDSGDLQMALRAAFHQARAKFDRGDLTGARQAIDAAVRFTFDAGLEWSMYGINVRYLQFMVYYTCGDWTSAARISDGFGVRVGTTAEAQLSSFALFLDVAMGKEAAAERLRWLDRMWDEDTFLNYIGQGLAAEHHLWPGDIDRALRHARAARGVLHPNDPAVIRIGTTELWALADQAVWARTTGDSATAQEAAREADHVLSLIRKAAVQSQPGEPRAWLGLEGHAWLARAEAEWHRVHGDDKPEHWRRVVEAFDYGFVYEVARSRWRLAASLAEHGERAEAEAEWREATRVAEELGAAPLARALADLGRRAGFTASPSDKPGKPEEPTGRLASLTSREREVLRLVAQGLPNREIAAALYISPKTASVHVSNIMAKLGVTTRTQAAAVAHREGLPDHS